MSSRAQAVNRVEINELLGRSLKLARAAEIGYVGFIVFDGDDAEAEEQNDMRSAYRRLVGLRGARLVIEASWRLGGFEGKCARQFSSDWARDEDEDLGMRLIVSEFVKAIANQIFIELREKASSAP